MKTLFLGNLCLVFRWTGISGCLARYRWGKSGQKWPTFHCGPVVIMTGPAL